MSGILQEASLFTNAMTLFGTLAASPVPKKCARASSGLIRSSHRGAASATIADSRLAAAESFLLAAVVIRRARIASANAGLEKRIQQRIGKVGIAYAERAGIAAVKVRAPRPGFLPPEIGQDMR